MGDSTTRSVALQVDDRQIAANVYLPAGALRRRPGVVLSLGAADLGGRDPRVVNLATMLARSGFVTLAVTGAPGLAGHHAEGALDLEAAPNAVVAAFKYLCAREDVDPRRVGLMGVCIGGGACLLAAARPELAREVRFVFLIGPYVSLRSVLRAIASRTAMSADGRMRPWQPSEWAVERQRAWLARLLSPAERAAVLLAVARHDPAPMALSSHGQAVFELVTGASPDRADQLIETLGDAFSKMLEAVSPAGCLADVRAETLVMHSVDDGLIPVEESRRLADALRGQVSLQYAEFELFEHVDVSRFAGGHGARPRSVATGPTRALVDALRLLSAWRRLTTARASDILAAQ